MKDGTASIQPNQEKLHGEFGGRFVPETLMTAVLELDKTTVSKKSPAFQAELDELPGSRYVGRRILSISFKNRQPMLAVLDLSVKRRSLNHGAHKISQ